jgi:hypothetical protein
VVESTKSQVLHFDDRQGKVPFCDVETCARELWTRVSQILLLKAGERGGGGKITGDQSAQRGPEISVKCSYIPVGK